MAMIRFEANNGFLNKVCVGYAYLIKYYFINLSKLKVWLTMIFMLLSFPIYLLFLPFYLVYLILSFAQSYENLDIDNGFLFAIVIIIKIALLLPSYAFIMFAYFPAMFIGGIVTIVSIPCSKVALADAEENSYKEQRNKQEDIFPVDEEK